MDSELHINNIYCKFCKKLISSDKISEFENGFHEICHKMVIKYDKNIGQVHRKFLEFEQAFPVPLNITFEESLEENFTLVRLNNLGIDFIPEGIDCLKNTKSLFFDNNQLNDLPISLSYLKNLTYLSLSSNKFDHIPKIVFEIENLETLFLKYNYLTVIPSTIIKLKKLKRLIVSNNMIPELPDELNLSSSLVWIDVSKNKLKDINTIPPNASELILSSNNFTRIPDCVISHPPSAIAIDNNPICSLPKDLFENYKLKKDNVHGMELNVNGCGLTSFPDTICDIKFSSIFASYNKISSLPDRLGSLSSISALMLSRNPIKRLPEHLLDHKMRYLQLDNTKIDYLPKITELYGLSIKNTNISEFPDLSQMIGKKMYSLDISNTKIEKIPEYVKSIDIESVYISNPSMSKEFSPKSKVILKP